MVSCKRNIDFIDALSEFNQVIANTDDRHKVHEAADRLQEETDAIMERYKDE